MYLIGKYKKQATKFMSVDLQQWRISIQYGRGYCEVLSGEDLKPLADYPDTTDESVLQYVFDTLDGDKLYNDYLYEAIQSVLDLWLIEDLSAPDARKQLLILFTDHCNFGG
jgi:hypothetical protein